jgi:hypothetical protein
MSFSLLSGLGEHFKQASDEGLLPTMIYPESDGCL